MDRDQRGESSNHHFDTTLKLIDDLIERNYIANWELAVYNVEYV